MASRGQKQGLLRKLFFAGFDSHVYCARCRDQSKGDEPCVRKGECKFCNILSNDQKAHLATPTYQEKKKEHAQKAIMEESSGTVVEPSSVTAIVLYCVFILRAISPYTTGLKALFNQSDCTGTAPTHK